MDNRTYKFRSGFTIRARDDYDPRRWRMTQEAYREANPPPEPPILEKKVPVKGGFRTITQRDYQDETYQRAYTIWDAQMLAANIATLYELAIDPDSIDPELLAAGRAWAEQQGIGLSNDPVRAYLRLVTSEPDENAKPDTPTELNEFHTWLFELKGPSEALVNQFIDTFRATIQGKTHLQRLAAPNGRQGQVEPKSVVDVQ